MTKNKLYELTSDHRAELKPWSDKWIANALSTKAMDDEEREIVRKSVKGLYEAADLKAPDPDKIIFVPSPFVLRFASGFASAILHLRDRENINKSPTYAATGDATDAAIRDATHAATYAATRAATNAATSDATYAATRAATSGATYAAISDATEAATHAATYDATSDATNAAISDATRAATRAATYAATRAATYAATYDATRAATEVATYAATSGATEAATRAATYAATYDATDAATDAATYDAIIAATYAATDAATRAAIHAATNAATNAAISDATRAATYDATRTATSDATSDATYAATSDATYDATSDATSDAIHAATYAATDAATDAATYAATYAATDAATDAAISAATYDATSDAIHAATYAATDAATYDATNAATSAATSAAIRDATSDATYDATYDATNAATYDATYDAISGDIHHGEYYNLNVDSMKKISKLLKIDKLGLYCAQNSYRMYQGGNQWSPWAAFLSFFRHIAKLDINYDKWEHWEKLAIHSGPRIMHKDFCMVSDRPEVLLIDEQNRPHCETGPFCKWRDGSSIYALHGVYVPMWSIEIPKDKIDPKRVLSLANTEQRMAVMRHVGITKFLDALGAELIHNGDRGDRLYYLNVENNKIGPYLFMRCPSTGREFLEGVGDADKYEFIDPNIKTCDDAHIWRLERARGKNKFMPIMHQGDVCVFDRTKLAKVIDINSIKVRA